MEVQSLGCEDALEEGMATHSSILAWRIPWTEENGELQSLKHLACSTQAHKKIAVLTYESKWL